MSRPAPPTAASDPGPLPAALLIVHGIGEQRPYATLDSFARGLCDAFDLPPRSIAHRITWRDGRAVSALRVMLPGPLPRSGARSLDLHELYWADLAGGGVTLLRILAWLLATGLTPLRLFSSQPAVLFREEGAWRRRAWIFAREMLRAALLLLITALIVAPPLWAAFEYEATFRALDRAWAALVATPDPLPFLAWGAVTIMVGVLAAAGGGLFLSAPRHQTAMERTAFRFWRAASLLSALILAAAAAWIDVAWRLEVLGLATEVGRALVRAPAGPAILALTAAALIRRPIIGYLGDIVLYVTADERSRLFRAREAILDRATARLKDLLADQDYGAVYVAGHSLGSVIAYDALNRLAREVRSAGGGPGKIDRAAFDRLRGLLTFGSPLDKVYYFFRTRVGRDEALRAQILSSVHGFRKSRSGRDYGRFAMAPYEVPEPPGFLWLNVRAVADRISGPLDFYRVDRDERRPYWNPLTAHLAYFADPGFFRAVRDWL